MQEVKDVKRTDIGEVQEHVLDMMKHTVSGPDGKVPDELAGAFEKVDHDEDGTPVIQTVSGILFFEADALAKGDILYSANLGVDNEGLSIEVANLTKYLLASGYNLAIVPGHYIDANGTISYGEEARKVLRHVEHSIVLQQIQQMQQNLKHPGLILPEGKIITR